MKSACSPMIIVQNSAAVARLKATSPADRRLRRAEKYSASRAVFVAHPVFEVHKTADLIDRRLVESLVIAFGDCSGLGELAGERGFEGLGFATLFRQFRSGHEHGEEDRMLHQLLIPEEVLG